MWGQIRRGGVKKEFVAVGPTEMVVVGSIQYEEAWTVNGGGHPTRGVVGPTF